MLDLPVQTAVSVLPIGGPWPVCAGEDWPAAPNNGTTTQPLRQATLSAADEAQDFVCGDENRLLVATLECWLEQPAAAPQPLVLCGPPATGKSHLLWGLARRLARQNDPGAVVALSGLEFVTTLSQAHDRDRLPAWQQRLRQARYLLIDELTQLTARSRAWQELRFTLDELTANGGQALITTRLSPELIPGMSPSLLSRLEAGQIVAIQSPGPAARGELWRRYARKNGLDWDPGALEAVLPLARLSAVEIWQTLVEFEAGCEPHEARTLTLAWAKSLGQPQRNGSRLNLRSMATLSAKYFGVKLQELLSPTRRRTVVEARNLVIYLARELGDVSLEQLGKFFGGRDHTTVLHGYRTIETKLRSDPKLRQAHDDLRKLIVQGGMS